MRITFRVNNYEGKYCVGKTGGPEEWLVALNKYISEDAIVSLSIYTNKVGLQKQLNKLVGEPTKEDMIKRSIAGSRWEIPLSDKVRISRLVLKANLFEL